LARQLRTRWLEVAGQVRTQARSLLLSAEQSGVSHRRVVEQLLPARAELLERTQREFNAMLLGVFELLQAKRAHIQAQKAEVRWHREQLIATTRLEQLLAGSLPLPTQTSALSFPGLPLGGPAGGTLNTPGHGAH
jgi:outer membrane protein, heavy metal efflux system